MLPQKYVWGGLIEGPLEALQRHYIGTIVPTSFQHCSVQQIQSMTAIGFYDKKIESVHRGGGDVRTKIGSICSRFPENSKPIKNRVGNLLR